MVNKQFDFFQNKTILITGAAGSIGAKLSEKIISSGVKQLILLDNAESPLYDLQQELLIAGYNNFEIIIADIRHDDTIKQVFERFQIDIVFHAAAYKHVPLMEKFPHQAIQTNVLGTKIIADLSIKYGIDKFIFISTDKAVNPASIMGASKCLAENYLRGLQSTETSFIITRFGNVVASNGSVIPLFKKQIEKGGPVTVTHKDVQRFFMTFDHATHLVLEACIIGSDDHTFVFEMGSPVKILNIADELIKESGRDDLEIDIVGLRPGEKIEEELFNTNETPVKTSVDNILLAQTDQKGVSLDNILQLLNDFSTLSRDHIIERIHQILPQYIPNNSIPR